MLSAPSSIISPSEARKGRVIFNCSVKYQGSSLNDQLQQGPDLTKTVVGVSTRIREEPVAFMADIKAMLYQVRVQPNDCKYLRFLWWPYSDLGKEPEEYQMLVHLFSGASSRSQLHILRSQKQLQKIIKEILRQLTVTVATVKRNS